MCEKPVQTSVKLIWHQSESETSLKSLCNQFLSESDQRFWFALVDLGLGGEVFSLIVLVVVN